MCLEALRALDGEKYGIVIIVMRHCSSNRPTTTTQIPFSERVMLCYLRPVGRSLNSTRCGRQQIKVKLNQAEWKAWRIQHHKLLQARPKNNLIGLKTIVH